MQIGRQIDIVPNAYFECSIFKMDISIENCKFKICIVTLLILESIKSWKVGYLRFPSVQTNVLKHTHTQTYK